MARQIDNVFVGAAALAATSIAIGLLIVAVRALITTGLMVPALAVALSGAALYGAYKLQRNLQAREHTPRLAESGGARQHEKTPPGRYRVTYEYTEMVRGESRDFVHETTLEADSEDEARARGLRYFGDTALQSQVSWPRTLKACRVEPLPSAPAAEMALEDRTAIEVQREARMNRWRVWILRLALLVLVLMIASPPWQAVKGGMAYRGRSIPETVKLLGYAPLWSPPEPPETRMVSVKIDYGRLGLQIVGLGALAALLSSIVPRRSG